MKTFFYWASRVVAVIAAALVVFVLAYHPSYVPHLGTTVSMTALDQVYFLLIGWYGIGKLALLVATAVLLLTTDGSTWAHSVLKWITTVALVALLIPVGFGLLLYFGDAGPGSGDFLILFSPLVLVATPVLILGICGILISEWSARRTQPASIV